MDVSDNRTNRVTCSLSLSLTPRRVGEIDIHNRHFPRDRQTVRPGCLEVRGKTFLSLSCLCPRVIFPEIDRLPLAVPGKIPAAGKNSGTRNKKRQAESLALSRWVWSGILSPSRKAKNLTCRGEKRIPDVEAICAPMMPLFRRGICQPAFALAWSGSWRRRQ